MLDKLFDIFKKSGESKVIVLDKQTGDFYVLAKWDEYEKLLAPDRSGKAQTPKNAEVRAEPAEQAITQENNNNISTEERFFFE